MAMPACAIMCTPRSTAGSYCCPVVMLLSLNVRVPILALLSAENRIGLAHRTIRVEQFFHGVLYCFKPAHEDIFLAAHSQEWVWAHGRSIGPQFFPDCLQVSLFEDSPKVYFCDAELDASIGCLKGNPG